MARVSSVFRFAHCKSAILLRYDLLALTQWFWLPSLDICVNELVSLTNRCAIKQNTCVRVRLQWSYRPGTSALLIDECTQSLSNHTAGGYQIGGWCDPMSTIDSVLPPNHERLRGDGQHDCAAHALYFLPDLLTRPPCIGALKYQMMCIECILVDTLAYPLPLSVFSDRATSSYGFIFK